MGRTMMLHQRVSTQQNFWTGRNQDGRHSATHPFAVMSGADAQSRKRHGSFWGWADIRPDGRERLTMVGSRHGSDRVASGGFASLLKKSCRSASDPKTDIGESILRHSRPR
jgi:hypothetical protein